MTVSRYPLSSSRGHLAAMFSTLAMLAPHGMLLSLPRVAARQAVAASATSAAAQCCTRRAHRCGGVRCQIFPGDFARQSDQEEDEAGDAARAVLRARRAVGGAVPPDEGPSQEWSEGVLDGAAPVSKIPGPVGWMVWVPARIGQGCPAPGAGWGVAWR